MVPPRQSPRSHRTWRARDADGRGSHHRRGRDRDRRLRKRACELPKRCRFDACGNPAPGPAEMPHQIQRWLRWQTEPSVRDLACRTLDISDESEGAGMRKSFEIGGFIAAAVLIVFGIGAIVMGVNARSTVNSSLSQEQIV